MFNLRVYGVLLGPNNEVLVSDELIRGGYYTKFPGGGLEFGEGTRDCLKREFKEEMDLEVAVGDHLYTTDFFQMSAFNPDHQIISIYYWVTALEPIRAPLRQKPFDFDEREMKMYAERKETETFRFIDAAEFDENTVTLPIDKVVAALVKRYLAIIALLLCTLFSCSKHATTKPQPTPPPTTPPVDTTLSINLTYPQGDTADFGNTFELIIAEPGGKVLLDTIALYNVPVVAKMTTTKAVLNVATIIQGITFSYYGVNIYTSVQPANWEVIPGNAVPLSYPNATTAQVVYTNAPAYDPNSTLISSLPATTSTGLYILYDNTNHVVKVNYPGRTNDYIYILFPSLGLYSYQPVNTSYDTISLAQMDTATKVFYSMPPQYTLHSTYLRGYPDTTDFTKYQSLYLYWQNQTGADLQYPPPDLVPMQKYALEVEASTPTEYINYQTFGAPPAAGTLTLPFPTTPIYTLNTTANDSFSVSFSQQPTNYGTLWSAGNIDVTIIAPPDSTKIKALPLLTSLNSKLIQGKTLSTLALLTFTYENVSGMEYNSYFLHQTNSAQMNTNPFTSDLQYTNEKP